MVTIFLNKSIHLLDKTYWQFLILCVREFDVLALAIINGLKPAVLSQFRQILYSGYFLRRIFNLNFLKRPIYRYSFKIRALSFSLNLSAEVFNVEVTLKKVERPISINFR